MTENGVEFREPLPDDVPVADKAAPVDEVNYQAFLKWQRENAARAEQERIANAPVEYYVHLADGQVERVKVDDFPVNLTVEHGGHFIKDGYAHTVIGVYPVENRIG